MINLTNRKLVEKILESKNYENTISIINRGNIIKNEIYSTIIEIITNTKNTIFIINETYNNRIQLYKKNKKDFEENFKKILYS
jgi:predicted nucleic-acid-binding protein